MSKRSSSSKKNRLSEMKLPRELEMDILSRLPVKSLLRFRCVSKEWLRLLTVDTQFIDNMHLPRSLTSNSNNPNPSFISLHDYKLRSSCYLEDYKVAKEEEGSVVDVKPIFLELPMDDNQGMEYKNAFRHCYSCVGTCNGLVCLTLHERISDREKMLLKELFVWNPLTRDHITLSSSGSPPYDSAIFSFGFCQATNEYKVVRILIRSPGWTGRGPPPPVISVCVNTLGTKTWRSLGDVSYDFNDTKSTITLNGAPHWLIPRSQSKYDLIVTFDVEDEVFQEIPLPLSFENQHNNLIQELGGLLCIYANPAFKEEFEMWVMKEHGVASSWTKLFNITQSEIPWKIDWWSPIGIACNGEITFRNHILSRMELLLYNPETNSFKGRTDFPFYLYRVITFAGSLVSPKFIVGGARQITLTE